MRRIILLGVILMALAAGLMLDLRARGLAWRFFWSQTGEEEPLAQIRGMIEWAGNLIRAQPRNDPLVPVQHTGENPFGMNTFLQLEPDPAKIEQQARADQRGGVRVDPAGIHMGGHRDSRARRL